MVDDDPSANGAGQELVSRSYAKKHGLVRYFTGNPCKHGHICERQVTNKTCIRCAGIVRKRLYDADPKRWQDASKAWVEANRERAAKTKRDYRTANRDRLDAYHAGWSELNSDRLKAYRKVYGLAYRLANMDEFRARARTRRARRRAADGKHTGPEIKDLLLKQKSKCANCRVGIAKGYHADHIQALSRGGSNWISNIQLLCASCNQRKFAKDPIKWAHENGRLL